MYFDNAATTRPSKKVLKAIANAPWGNSNSVHSIGREAKKLVKKTAKK
jgi:cysteine sulfinate desulfinase/cysteine desulfurase-like protein